MRQTGAIQFNQAGTPGVGLFPRQYRRTLASRLDRNFVIIFGSLLVVCGATVWVLSHRNAPSERVASDKEITRIQERYAQLVLNQPKPREVAPLPTEKIAPVKREAVPEADASEPKTESRKIDRANETYVDRAVRREASQMARSAVREQVAQQVRSSGIFAAITASGSGMGAGSAMGGESAAVSDLLGTVGGEGGVDLGSVTISKGAFATKNVDAATVLASRKAGPASAIKDITPQAVQRVENTQLASTGEVTITTQAPQISNDNATTGERSYDAINRAVNRYTVRLKRVYETWLKQDPALAGKVTIKFTIMPDGSVTNCTLVSSTSGNSEFDQNIMRYIGRWTFTPASDSGPVEVVYPFVFEGMG
jgi:TonB family protein